jgi:hypothetical protein
MLVERLKYGITTSARIEVLWSKTKIRLCFDCSCFLNLPSYCQLLHEFRTLECYSVLVHLLLMFG